MSKRSKKTQKAQARLEGFVVVAFAEDMEQASEYKTLLEANDIHAVINENNEHPIGYWLKGNRRNGRRRISGRGPRDNRIAAGL